MEKMMQPRERREKPELTLTSLDVKGREIAGLEPKMERFSYLQDESVEPLAVNDQVTCNADLKESLVFVHPQKGEVQRLVAPPHWRTVTREHIEASVKTKYGVEHYYEINTKGVGYLKPTVKGGHSLDEYQSWYRMDENELKGAYGLAEYDDFYNAKGEDIVKRTKKLTDLGLRTELFWFIGKLKSLYYQGELVPVKTLRERRVIPPSTHYRPEIGVRLLKTNTRIAEVVECDPLRARSLLENAYETFNRETKDKALPYGVLRCGDEASDRTFFRVFAERMGQNLAVLLNNGLVGWHLHSANTTMAAEIVDVGPLIPWREDNVPESAAPFNGVRRASLKDMRDIAYSLRMLFKAAKQLGVSPGSAEEYCSSFTRAFDAALDAKTLESKQKTKAEDLRDAAKKIFEAVLVQERKLGAIKHGFDVTDWDLGFTAPKRFMGPGYQE